MYLYFHAPRTLVTLILLLILINRIPGLSNKFLYLNDDVFLGREVWPEDFITQANGQKVYLAWWVPDCSDVCPWAWVGDSACDPVCNTTICEFDGGDCDIKHIPADSEGLDEDPDYPYGIPQSDSFSNRQAARLLDILIKKNKLPTVETATSLGIVRKLQSHPQLFNVSNIYTEQNFFKTDRNVSELQTLRKEISVNRSTLINGDESQENTQLKRYRNDNIINLVQINNPKIRKVKPVDQFKHKSRRLDTYAESLLYVNKIYNTAYGFERRRVPAHMPHLLDKWIIAEMQEKFETEFKKTSAHRVRDSEDMQFAFSYFYYLVSERRKTSVAEIFDKFDTDKSG